ncbi:hypothetical protein [Coleofasciculus sp.]|uniref:hypothetical protein n=1 Tax=Coleofasciculus sp. TaxID=3100458 RepID=UPI003A4C1AB3
MQRLYHKMRPNRYGDCYIILFQWVYPKLSLNTAIIVLFYLGTIAAAVGSGEGRDRDIALGVKKNIMM